MGDDKNAFTISDGQGTSVFNTSDNDPSATRVHDLSGKLLDFGGPDTLILDKTARQNKPYHGKVALVIPTIRDVWDTLEKWGNRFEGVEIIICEDHDTKELAASQPPMLKTLYGYHGLQHYSHKEMKEDLGSKNYIIPHRNASVRSYGYYKAWKQGYEYILTLDDDCYPYENTEWGGLSVDWVADHVEALESKTTLGWVTTPDNLPTRGFPYDIRNSAPVMANHGLWANVPDHDGMTQLVGGSAARELMPYELNRSETIPYGSFFPMCGMNLAFRRDAAPLMYFLLQGRDYEFDRYDDIWAGVLAKKAFDILGWAFKNGSPAVYHSRASIPMKNMVNEAPGLEVNERFWKHIDQFMFFEDTGPGPVNLYRELAEWVEVFEHDTDYFRKLAYAMKDWADLFDNAS